MTVPKVYLAIKNPAFSHALRQLWCQQSGTVAVGSGDNLKKLREDLKALQADVLVLDSHLFTGKGMDSIDSIQQLRPEIKILMVTDSGCTRTRVSLSTVQFELLKVEQVVLRCCA